MSAAAETTARNVRRIVSEPPSWRTGIASSVIPGPSRDEPESVGAGRDLRQVDRLVPAGRPIEREHEELDHEVGESDEHDEPPGRRDLGLPRQIHASPSCRQPATVRDASRRSSDRRAGGDPVRRPASPPRRCGRWLRPRLRRPAGRAETRRLEPLGVDLGELLPVRGEIVLGEDRGHGAHGDACVAVHALVGLDVEHPPLVDAVDRALVHAGLVLDVDARFGDHVCHQVSFPPGLSPRP